MEQISNPSIVTTENGSASIRTFRVTQQLTVKQFLAEIRLKPLFFVIIVNGVRANLDTIITPSDEIVMLPRIAGG